MATICEIQQQLWFDTPKGQARAKFLVDTGDDGDMQWVCFYPNGEIWTWQNYEVRVSKNITMGIRTNEKREEFVNYLKKD